MSLTALEETLKKATEWIRSEKLQNEAQTKQAVILPILRCLGWDDANPNECFPEYTMRSRSRSKSPNSTSGRVDYALCRTDTNPPRPLIFIEAKSLGRIDDEGEEQLFHYAYNEGAQLLILTDGDVWHFYLSGVEGLPAERRFYRAVLSAVEKTAEYARSFDCFLSKKQVESGEALSQAMQLHTNRQAKDKAKSTIPKIWRNLLENEDSDLRNTLATAVQNECGTRPESDDLDQFLREQLHPVPPPTPSTIARPIKPRAMQGGGALRPRSGIGTRIIGSIFNGKENLVGAGNKTLAEILKEFHRTSPEFMLRFATETEGHTRRLVAQNRENLYDKQHLTKYAIDLNNGWWLRSNFSQNPHKDQNRLSYCRCHLWITTHSY